MKLMNASGATILRITDLGGIYGSVWIADHKSGCFWALVNRGTAFETVEWREIPKELHDMLARHQGNCGARLAAKGV